MVAKIDSFGRIVIPKEVRDRLGLSPGADVELAQEGSSLRLFRAEQVKRIVDNGGLLCVEGVEWQGSRDGSESGTLREERLRKVSGMA